MFVKDFCRMTLTRDCFQKVCCKKCSWMGIQGKLSGSSVIIWTLCQAKVWLWRKLPFMAYCQDLYLLSRYLTCTKIWKGRLSMYSSCPHGKLPLNRRQEVTANKFIFFSWKVFLHLFLSHYAAVFQNVRRFPPGLICWPHTDNKFISNYHNYVNPRHCI